MLYDCMRPVCESSAKTYWSNQPDDQRRRDNVLMGPNGAGKTTLLKALRIMTGQWTGDICDTRKNGTRTTKFVFQSPIMLWRVF